MTVFNTVQRIKIALLKDANERSTNDKHVLYTYFSEIAFFKKLQFSKTDLSRICSRLHYEKIPPKSYVIKQGDIGDKFYIMLKGQVDVWIPVKLEDALD